MKKSWMILGIICSLLILNLVYAEKLEINIKEANPEKVVFKINLYDNYNNIIDGNVDYLIEDYYTDVMKQGNANSGEDIVYELPANPVQGPWKITAKYNEIEANELFQVGKLEKADIKLVGDNLVIENIGNSVYDRNILISIGESKESARVYLEVGGIKKIKLTAPPGEYIIKINDGTNENTLTFSGVSLTGNAVGIERVMEGNFFQKFPLVSLFLLVLVMVIVVVSVLKMYRKYMFSEISKSSKSKSRRKKI